MNNTTTSTVAGLPRLSLLLLLSFIEGACVMVAELAGGKMLAPFYGTSIYVWASTLAITLGGLTIGYYLGGKLSDRSLAKRKQILFLTLALAAALVMVMPVWASFIMTHTLEMSFLPGLITSQSLFLLLPITGMGMVSPLIIGLIGENRNSGSAAGSVYAISTLGGIIATLLTGFWLVSTVGISIPCVAVGALLLVAALLVLKPSNKLPAALLVSAMPSLFYVYQVKAQESGKYKLLYYSEGVLGQVKVLEFQTKRNGKTITARNMLVNHNWQTWIDKDNPDYSFLYYTRFTRAVINSLPEKSSALLIGLGGGTVARQMEERHVAYDAVEIDGRLPELAKEYFGLKGSGNLVVDDGRHYINKCKKMYDLVIIDALLGENVPSHLLSVECFSNIKKILKPGGRIFIEFDGIEPTDDGQAQQLVYNTLVQAGFNCMTFSSVPGEKDSDIMFLAGGNKLNIEGISVPSDPYYEYKGALKDFSMPLSGPTTAHLTDDKPELDYLLRNRMASVRNNMLRQANIAFLENDMMFYY